jgi:hypothetical protein
MANIDDILALEDALAIFSDDSKSKEERELLAAKKWNDYVDLCRANNPNYQIDLSNAFIDGKLDKENCVIKNFDFTNANFNWS